MFIKTLSLKYSYYSKEGGARPGSITIPTRRFDVLGKHLSALLSS